MTPTNSSVSSPPFGVTEGKEGVYHIHHNRSDHPELSTVICIVVAHLRSVDPTELEPLSRTIDPDALNELFPPHTTESSADGQVQFTFADYLITVHATGKIEFRQPSG